MGLKVLHAPDLHYNRQACMWLADNQQIADIVCLTGDFLDTRYNAPVALSEQVEFFLTWFTLFSVPLLVCSGNHDVVFAQGRWLNTDNLNGVYGDGSNVIVEGIRFGCVPYENNPDAFADCQVLLHHEPPFGSKTAQQNGVDYGSRALQHALKSRSLSARYILCGHVHSPAKRAVRKGACTIVNAGGIHSNDQPSYAVVELDLA